MVRLLFVFAVFMLVQSPGFGQETVRYLDQWFFEVKPRRESKRVYFQVERKLTNKTRTKTYTMDSTLVSDLTEGFDVNGNLLFSTRLQYLPNGKLKSKCDFDRKDGITACNYFNENGNIRTVQKSKNDEILESVSYDENGEVVDEMLDCIATPKGGLEEWKKYLVANIRSPAPAARGLDDGTMYLKVYVDSTGKIIKAIPFGGEVVPDPVIFELSRVVLAYPDRWNPAKFNGRPEGSTFRLIADFKFRYNN